MSLIICLDQMVMLSINYSIISSQIELYNNDSGLSIISLFAYFLNESIELVYFIVSIFWSSLS